MRVSGTIVAVAVLVAITTSLIAVYYLYILPTRGRYCMLSAGNQSVRVVRSVRVGGNGTLELLVMNTAGHPVLAVPDNLSICLIGSNGRLSCDNYGMRVPNPRVLKPGEGLPIVVRYEVDRLGITLAVTMAWAGNHTIYFSRAVKARVYYVIVSWLWPECRGGCRCYRSISLVCKNWVGPT